VLRPPRHVRVSFSLRRRESISPHLPSYSVRFCDIFTARDESTKAAPPGDYETDTYVLCRMQRMLRMFKPRRRRLHTPGKRRRRWAPLAAAPPPWACGRGRRCRGQGHGHRRSRAPRGWPSRWRAVRGTPRAGRRGRARAARRRRPCAPRGRGRASTPRRGCSCTRAPSTATPSRRCRPRRRRRRLRSSRGRGQLLTRGDSG